MRPNSYAIGDVAVFTGYTTREELPLFREGELVVIVDRSQNNPDVFSCVKLREYPAFLKDDPSICGDEVWSHELKRPDGRLFGTHDGRTIH
jgi:hypothetical protein